ncbi:hypothetical protein D3C72_2565480 [compost metagenome]
MYFSAFRPSAFTSSSVCPAFGEKVSVTFFSSCEGRKLTPIGLIRNRLPTSSSTAVPKVISL